MKAAEPKLEVSEDENEVKVAAELPGMSEKDVDLEISADGYLTIRARKSRSAKNMAREAISRNFLTGRSNGRWLCRGICGLTTQRPNLTTVC